jgi:tetratricopeptide (TPR) repeat protein
MKPKNCAIVSLIISAIFFPSYAADMENFNAQGIKAFEQGRYREAVEYFVDALKQTPNDRTIAQNLANSCRTLAANYCKQDDNENAIAALRKGLAYLPREALLRKDLMIVLINEGTVFLGKKDYARAQRDAASALEIDNADPAANRLAGDIAYALHDLAAALKYWQAVVKADPGNAAVARRIEQLGKEQNVERNYSKMEAYHFDIRFDEQALGNGVYDLRKFLMEAYETIGKDFDRFPDYPIVVVLSKENEFRLVNAVPGYVAGLYDGKIRVPVNYSHFSLASLKGVLFHEYTHAMIYDLAGSSCPIWLNEGIAMREMNVQSSADVAALRLALTKGTTLSLDLLGDPAVWRDPGRIPLAYAQSWMMTEYLFSRWSNGQIKNMLLRFKQGASFTALLQENMNRTPSQFDEEWKDYARGRM